MICIFLCFLDLFYFGLFGKSFVSDRFVLGMAGMLEIPFDFLFGVFIGDFWETFKCRH